MTIKPAANGAATIWAANSSHPALTPLVERPAAGSVTVPAGGVASALYQAAYFQAVDNPKAPQHDLVNVLLADVAAQVYATEPDRERGLGEERAGRAEDGLRQGDEPAGSDQRR